MSWQRFRHIPKAEADAFEKEFRKKSRFLVDESLGPEATRVLKQLGWNTVYAGDVGLNGRDDTDVYSFGMCWQPSNDWRISRTPAGLCQN